ncbi:MAG: hypothetical protein FJ044_03200 [Candidatus Cloacimonetes bacterium]|nr:hypothetical protein [Candidatus Cloacimonadota bacterium]
MKLPRNRKGQFIKGYHYSLATELKGGQHWREPKPFWQKEWLEREYIKNQRSANEIAKQFGITEGAILFWLHKHGIPRRRMTEIRKIKHWGLEGEKNGMYSRRGKKHPRWLGGASPMRQKIYASLKWKQIEKWIRKEQKYCRICKSQKKLIVHHWLSMTKFPQFACEKWNLIRICEKCHKIIHKKNLQGGL